MSKKHCRIEYGESGDILVEDLDSSNGVFVNKEKITKTKIRSGDYIIVGNFVLQLVPTVPRVSASSPSVKPAKNVFQPFGSFEQFSQDLDSVDREEAQKSDVAYQAKSFLNHNIYPLADRLSKILM